MLCFDHSGHYGHHDQSLLETHLILVYSKFKKRGKGLCKMVSQVSGSGGKGKVLVGFALKDLLKAFKEPFKGL